MGLDMCSPLFPFWLQADSPLTPVLKLSREARWHVTKLFLRLRATAGSGASIAPSVPLTTAAVASSASAASVSSTRGGGSGTGGSSSSASSTGSAFAGFSVTSPAGPGLGSGSAGNDSSTAATAPDVDWGETDGWGEDLDDLDDGFNWGAVDNVATKVIDSTPDTVSPSRRGASPASNGDMDIVRKRAID